MPRRPRPFVWLSFWIVLTLIAVLLPSPREWGAFGEWVSPHFDKVRGIIQPAAHFFLMAAIAAALTTVLAARPPLVTFAVATLVAVALSILFEFFQTLLPETFGRDADPSDVLSSMLGAMAGSALALLFRRKNSG